jgi:hypothetical protein
MAFGKKEASRNVQVTILFQSVSILFAKIKIIESRGRG